MRLVCIANAHAPYDGELMEKSAARVGVEVLRYREGEPWPKDFRVGKLVHGLEFIRTLPEDVTHVMFVDSSDTLFLAGPEEIVEKFELMMGDDCDQIVIQAEKNCYPDKALEPRYNFSANPDGSTPWKYVNSGGWIGRRECVESLLPIVIEQAEYCDQLCFTRALLDLRQAIRMDVNCQIFQSMYLQKPEEFAMENGRLENRLTGGRPCVAHWNGTRNEGKPYSRDDVWESLTGEKPERSKLPTIAICMPGNSFSNHWVLGFAGLYLEMVKYFGQVGLVNSAGNNIYQVRENCLKWWSSQPGGPPDYILWIDSDNPPSAINFAHLWAAIRENPLVSAVGGWYRFFDEINSKVMIAAGKMGDSWNNITEEEILAAEHLIQVPFIGFGMCLMTWKLVADIGVEKAFAPYIVANADPQTHRTWLTDDAGFFARAIEKGHKIFLHPAVFLEHEKQLNVPASIGIRNEIPTLKEA